MHYSGFTEYWDEDWKWVQGLTIDEENYVIAEDDAGISVKGPFPDYVYGNGDVLSMGGDYFPSKNNNGFDLPPGALWNGSSYTSMSYNISGYKSMFLDISSYEYTDRVYYNRSDGFLFSLISHPSLDGARHALFAYIGDEGSLFELNP